MGDLRTAAAARAVAAAAAAVTVGAGLAARALLPGVVGKPAGDALYTVLVYTLVLLVAPCTRPRSGAAVALALSVAVELGQLTGLPEALARHSMLARLVLGTTFHAPDLFWYAVGAALAGAAHATATRRPARLGT